MRKKINLIAVIVILLAVCATGIFYFAKSKKTIAPVKTEEKSNAEIVERKGESASEEQGGVESEGSYEPAGNGMYWFVVKEMGIKFKVKQELKDDGLVYYYEKNVPTPAYGKLAESIKFSTKELKNIDKNCSAKELPLGVFIKLVGIKSDYKNNEYIISRNPKQVKDFILYYNGPDAPCTNSDELVKKYKRYGDFLTKAFNSIQSVE